jgi:hypothetical protein
MADTATPATPDAASFGFGTPFEPQLQFFRRKLNLPSERWDDIVKSAHDRAFIVAGAAKADLVQDLRGAVDRAIASGSLSTFRRDFKAVVAKNGWTGWRGEGSAAGEAWRTRVIYQTNMATSYAVGQWAQMTEPEFAADNPFWRYVHSDGVLHPRPLHQAWHNTVLPKDHPFWKTHFAPNGWGCRCEIWPVKAPRAGDKTEPPAGWDALDPKTGAPVGIDRGFDYAPGANRTTPLRQMVQDKLITYEPAIAQALSAGLTRQIQASADVPAFVGQALASRQMQDSLWLGFLAEPKEFSALLGLDVRHYALLLPADAVRHVQSSHKHDGKGQRAPGPEDFAQLASMLDSPDTMRLGEPRQGQPTLVLTKRVGEETLRAVFEVLSGKRSRAIALLSLVVKVGR